MKGAVAAGHPLTARAGARVLEEGGNAVDACIAAGLAAWVTESPLTGPGAGGFMLVHRERDRMSTLLDFFVASPGEGLPADVRPRPMERVDVPFKGETTQPFYIGASSCAVPGAAAGLAEAHRLYGSLPWRVLLEPATELACGGVELNEAQAFLHEILDTVLRHGEDGRRVYGERRSLAAGERLVMPDLAETLELLAAEGARALYQGELARRISDTACAGGGLLTAGDLAAYRVIRRRPVRVPYQGQEFVSNPPPSAGGILIAYALRLLDRLGVGGPAGSAEALARLADVAREAARARAGGFVGGLYRAGLRDRLLADERVEEVARAVLAAGPRLPLPEVAGLPSTTHVSVLDSRGNAASLSSSTGCGSGVIVPGTGIQLNNMLGEADLNPGVAVSAAVPPQTVAPTSPPETISATRPRTGSLPGSPIGATQVSRPGRRLTSMMAPSIILREGRPLLVLGSAGSERLRGAIVQVALNVIDHGLPLGQAIDFPRVHLDGETIHCEGGVDPAQCDRLEPLGYEIVRWRERNLYFGGVAAVGVAEDGRLQAAGDPRRGGAGIVVP